MAVFIPLLLMGGMVGRLFREFSVTLSAAILISLVVSLTTTPMMCAVLLRPEKRDRAHGPLYRASEWVFELMRHTYEKSLGWALRHSRFMLTLTLLTVAINIVLFLYIPKGFFPEQDIGRLTGIIQAAQDISFQAMREKLQEVIDVIRSDPDVIDVVGFTGGGGGGGSTTNTARMFISLKPFEERRASARQVMDQAAPEARPGAGGPHLPAGGAGFAHRRHGQRRPLSVHPPGRQPRRAERLGPAGLAETAHPAPTGRCEQRSTE